MKNKHTLWIFPLIMGLVLMFSNSCSKDEAPTTPAAPLPVVYNSTLTYGTVRDIEGNVYMTIQIGTQTWMADNLRTTKYRNGNSIPIVTNNAWAALTSGAYCNYNNDPKNGATYGRLYNWYAVVDGRNIAPVGWHVPTDAEWTTLTNYLGGETVAGEKLKEADSNHWTSPNAEGANSSGFTALAGGYRDYDGPFLTIGDYCFWWSCTEDYVSNAWDRSLCYSTSITLRNYHYKTYGFSVRCVKD